MIVTRQANKVGMRQFARLEGEAMTSSKTSVGETNRLRSFSRIDVGEVREGVTAIAETGIVRVG